MLSFSSWLEEVKGGGEDVLDTNPTLWEGGKRRGRGMTAVKEGERGEKRGWERANIREWRTREVEGKEMRGVERRSERRL